MKKVLVPLVYSELTPGTIAPLNFARETYIKSLLEVGLTPLFVSHLFLTHKLDELYEECSGVIVMGGSDVSSHRYNKDPHEKTSSNPLQDELDFYVVKKALHDKKPLLGICRGHQVINVALGGSLIQHIPDITEEVHGMSEGMQYDHLLEFGHDILIEKNTTLSRLINEENIWVNSGHHQAIEDLGEGLVVSAKSPDGIIEAIEMVDTTQFCIGVQSHPEAPNNELHIPLFEGFAQACELFANKK